MASGRVSTPSRSAFGQGARSTCVGWSEHVAQARALLADRKRLARPPDDLADILTLLARGAPGVVMLRVARRAPVAGASP